MTNENELSLKLRAIERELARRRACDNLAKYNTGRKKHKKQLAFHKCKKRNRWVFGGNRSGKTECGAVEAVWMARGNHPYRKNRKNVFGWVVSLTMQVQRDVAQKKILHYLRPDQIVDIVMVSGRKDHPASGIVDQIIVKNVLGGTSVIGFKSCDQGRERFQGSSLDFVWFDEEPPREIYEECLMRVLDKEGDIFGTMTPLKGLTFVYEEIYLNRGQNPEVWYEFMEWADNPLSFQKRDRHAHGVHGRRNPRKPPLRKICRPRRTRLSRVRRASSRHRAVSRSRGLAGGDLHRPGAQESALRTLYAVDWDGNVYVVAEHYAAGHDIDYHANAILRLAEKLGWKRDARGRVEALIDSAASQRTLAAEKSVAELFSERGILADMRVEKDLFSGIECVKSYLNRDNGLPDLYIFSGCSNMIREFKSYFWGSGDAPSSETITPWTNCATSS